MTVPAFMWRLANDEEAAHCLLYGTLVVERRWLRNEQQVIVVAFPTPEDAHTGMLRSTEAFERHGLTLTAMYAIKDPDVLGLGEQIHALLHAYTAADDQLDNLTVTVLTVFVVAGEVLYV